MLYVNVLSLRRHLISNILKRQSFKLMQSSTSDELHELTFFKQERVVEVQTFIRTFEKIY